MVIDSQIPCFVDLSKWFAVKFDCTIAVDVEQQCLVGTDLEKLLSTEVRCRIDLALE